MSVNANAYERKLLSCLQQDLSKREAEQALYEIRASLYGSPYTMIRPIHLVDDRGHEQDKYPDVWVLINAYETGDYSSFETEEDDQIL